MPLARDDGSLAAEWWLTVDRLLLAGLLLLLGLGVVLSLAASPALALRKGLPTFHYVERHVVFAAAGLVVMLAASLLSPLGIRRAALWVLAAMLLAMGLAAWLGPEIKGARRWLHVLGVSLQPSELAKPAFVVLAAWAFGEAQKRSDVPALPVAIGLYVAMAAALLAQPDVGQTVLITLVWGALLVLSGQGIRGLLGFAGLAALGGGAAYLAFGHVQARIDRFLRPSAAESYQLDKALQSFADGGFLGKGPGEGTIKSVLPDAHTDFILAVIGEEYGILACLALLCLYAAITFRVLVRAGRTGGPFLRLAATGLALLLALQALINMGVSVGLLPPKGMTLPFISSGGSSILGCALAMGFMIAATRRRPDAVRAGGRDRTAMPGGGGAWVPGHAQ